MDTTTNTPGEAAVFGPDAPGLPTQGPSQPSQPSSIDPRDASHLPEEPVVTEPVAPIQPPVVTEIGDAPIPQDTQVFGPAVDTVAQEVQAEQTVPVPMSVLASIQAELAELRAAQTGENVIDPLAMGAKKKIINVGFYAISTKNEVTGESTSKQYLVSGYKERVSPTGERELVYVDGFDKNNNPIHKALVELTDIETGETMTMEVVWDTFMKQVRPVQKEAIRTNERIVDLTPAEETVEVTSYQESGGYVKRQGSGVLVRASVRGVVHTYVVDFNGKEFTIASDVVNIKQ